MRFALGSSVWLAIGYGVFLLLVAFTLDVLARRTATRSMAWRTGGFTYHDDHDAWVCPEDQFLWPESFDPDNRVMRYRASPTVCNACPVKQTCTTSHSGREVSRNVDPWPASEAERFHRGIACAVVVLALSWPVATLFTVHSVLEAAVLGAVIVLLAAASWPLWSHLRRSPDGFPVHVKAESLEESVETRRAASARDVARRTVYRSDLRTTAPEQDERQRVREMWAQADDDGQDLPGGWSRLKKS